MSFWGTKENRCNECEVQWWRIGCCGSQAFEYIIVCQFEICDPYNNQRSGRMPMFTDNTILTSSNAPWILIPQFIELHWFLSYCIYLLRLLSVCLIKKHLFYSSSYASPSSMWQLRSFLTSKKHIITHTALDKCPNISIKLNIRTLVILFLTM